MWSFENSPRNSMTARCEGWAKHAPEDSLWKCECQLPAYWHHTLIPDEWTPPFKYIRMLDWKTFSSECKNLLWCSSTVRYLKIHGSYGTNKKLPQTSIGLELHYPKDWGLHLTYSLSIQTVWIDTNVCDCNYKFSFNMYIFRVHWYIPCNIELHISIWQLR